MCSHVIVRPAPSASSANPVRHTRVFSDDLDLNIACGWEKSQYLVVVYDASTQWAQFGLRYRGCMHRVILPYEHVCVYMYLCFMKRNNGVHESVTQSHALISGPYTGGSAVQLCEFMSSAVDTKGIHVVGCWCLGRSFNMRPSCTKSPEHSVIVRPPSHFIWS